MSIVELKMTEVLDHLRENGEMEKAVNALIAKKGAGAAPSSVSLVNDLGHAGELSDSELGNVAGGTPQTLMAGAGLVLHRVGPGGAWVPPADTSW